MANQQGIAIVIKAFLPTGKTLDEQFNALGIVKAAHESGDYTGLLKAASVEEVKTEQKTRRIEDKPATTPTATDAQGAALDASGLKEAFDGADPKGDVDAASEPSGTVGGAQMEGDDEPSSEGVPEFLKKGKAKAA
jgi:hypothetical protein